MTDTPKTNLERYPWVVKWCRMKGSYSSYIENQCAQAIEDNAPEDAIFKDFDSGKWNTVRDLSEDHPFHKVL